MKRLLLAVGLWSACVARSADAPGPAAPTPVDADVAIDEGTAGGTGGSPAVPDAAVVIDQLPAGDEAVVADAAATPDAPTVGGPIEHRFLKGVSSEGSGTVAIVAADGKIEWQYPITGEANDTWLLPDGNVMFAFKTGCRIVTPAKQTVWEFNAAAGAQTHSCQPLPGGLTLVGESRADGTSYLYEIDGAMKVMRTIKLTLGGGAHNQFREVRKTPEGTYLTVEQRSGGKAQEWDATGKLVRSFPCGSFVAVRLPDAHTMIACGDDHKFIEVDAQGTIVWQLTENELPGNQIGFAAGMQRLPNGDTVLCNWAGHDHLHSQPQVIEVTRDKRVVWSVSDPTLGQISSIEILDPDIGTPLR